MSKRCKITLYDTNFFTEYIFSVQSVIRQVYEEKYRIWNFVTKSRIKEDYLMKIYLWSKKAMGKWAASLTLLFIVLMSLKMFTLGRLPLPTPFIAGLGVIGFISGIVSFIKNKDRSILTILSIPIGLLIIFWVAAEIAFPH